MRFEQGPRKRIDRCEQGAVRRIFSELDGCTRILDVPSGAGRFLAALGEKSRRVIEVDVAREILSFARRQSGRFNIQTNFIQGDAARLPFIDGAVDCVFCNRLLHHILSAKERAVFLRELHRVSRRYVVVSFFDYQAFGLLRRFLKVLKGRRPKYGGQPTRDQFHQEVIQCGFRVMNVVPTGPVWVAEKYFVLEKV